MSEIIEIKAKGIHPAFIEADEDSRLMMINSAAECYSLLMKKVQEECADKNETERRNIYLAEGKKEGREEVWREMEEQIESSLKLSHQVQSLERMKRILEAKCEEMERELEKEDERNKKERERFQKDREGMEEYAREKYESSLKRECEILRRQVEMEERGKVQSELVELNRRISLYEARMENEEERKQYIGILTRQIEEMKGQIENMTKTKTSVELGQIGEEETEGLLIKYVNCEYIRTAKESYSGDFQVTINGNKILIDSKKYTSSVDINQRKRIIRDTDRDGKLAGGIMISHDVPIQTKKNFDVEISPKNKPIMYLSFMNMGYEERGRSLEAALRVLERIVSIRETGERDSMIEKLTYMTREGEKVVKEMEGIHNTLTVVAERVRNARENLITSIKMMGVEEKLGEAAILAEDIGKNEEKKPKTKTREKRK